MKKTKNVTKNAIKDETKLVKPVRYMATIKVLGKSYHAEGETIAEAISKLKPINCKGKGILTVNNGQLAKDRVLMPAITYRLFNTVGMSKEIAIKNASLLFQGL
jgi:hypothetical protein